MELEVGMYVRTKYGIAKYIDDEVKSLNMIVIDRYIANEHIDGYENIIQPDEILKASHNIIDLIEVGDYVNGYKISAIYDDDSLVNEYNLKHKKCLGKNIYDEDYQEYLIYEEEIETIATKEQFEAMVYKVVE